MKRSSLILTGIALVLALCLDKSRAQDNPPPTAQQPAPTAPGVQPVPGQPVPGQNAPFQRPMMPPRARQPRMVVQRTMNDLRMLKTELQRSQDDFGGHKSSAIEACDKATEELDALLKAMPLPTPQQGGPPPRSSFQNNLTPVPPGGAPPGQAAPVPPPAPANPPTQPPPQP